MKHRKTSKIQNPQPVNSSNSGALAPQDHTLMSFAPSADEVACRAYLNYQNHGAADGHDVQDWLHAEAELIAERKLAGGVGSHNIT